jgi:DNA-binding FadR family transcriptional regulator
MKGRQRSMSDSLVPRRRNLTEGVIDALAGRIRSGAYAPGAKLPSEHELCREFGVSRTVVREAVASLRLGGQLVSRQGLGVFAADRDCKGINFEFRQADDIRSALQILELRLGVEVEAVTLAAARRTPAAIADMTLAFDRLNEVDPENVEEEALADFGFHLAIARAAANPHFPRFLEALGRDITLDLRLKHGRPASPQSRRANAKKIAREHSAILAAIVRGDANGARVAMRNHIREGLLRYRRLLETHAA